MEMGLIELLLFGFCSKHHLMNMPHIYLMILMNDDIVRNAMLWFRFIAFCVRVLIAFKFFSAMTKTIVKLEKNVGKVEFFLIIIFIFG